MNFLGIAFALLSLFPVPARAQGVGTVTLVDGSLRLIRGTAVLQVLEGTRLKPGDILETSDKGFAQLEFTGGAVVALGPASRAYILRHAGGKTGSDSAAEIVLLSGWLKGESTASAGSYRYTSRMLAATTANGTVVLHSSESGCDLFVEGGSAAIGEVSREGSPRQAASGKAGQFFSRNPDKNLVNAAKPSSAFVGAMPLPFRDTLPSRLAHFAGKSPEPKPLHQVSYAEIQPWLATPPAWRRGFVERFEPRLNDPEFRKQLESHAAEHPEWNSVLHPPASPPAAAPNSETPHLRIGI